MGTDYSSSTTVVLFADKNWSTARIQSQVRMVRGKKTKA